MESPNKVRSCFCCSAQFQNDQDFLQHVFEVDCSNLQHEPQAKITDISDENKESSPKKEPALSCGLCDVQFLSTDEQAIHIRSNEHRAQVAVAAERYSLNVNYKGNNAARVYSLFCNECQVPLPSHAAREIHVTGKKHKKKLAQLAQVETEHQEKKSNGSPDSGTMQPFNLPSYNRSEAVAPSTSISKDQFGLDLFSNGSCSNSTINYCHDSPEQTLNAVSTTCQLSTENNTELNTLLRRLCLTQILHLIYGLDEKTAVNSSNRRNGSPTSSFHPAKGVTEDVLLEMMRGICREELRKILPTHFFT